MKKKLLILLALLVAMTLVFVACKDDPQPPVDDTTVADQPTEEPTQGEEDPTQAPDTDPETPEPGTDEPDEPTTPAPDTDEPDTPAPDTDEPDTPEPETKDPMEPVNVFDADDIQTVTGGDPNNMTQDCLTLEDGFVHIVPIGPDPYYYPFAGVDGARYVAIRYRTDATGADIQMYIGSTGGGPSDDSTMLRQPVVADSEWHVAIFDTQSLIDAGKYDGKYVSYFRFDALEAGYKLNENGETYKNEDGTWARYSLPEGCSIDVAYIGFFHSTEAAQKYDFEQYPPFSQITDAGMKGHSFDTFYVNGQMYFPEDGNAGGKLNDINNTLTFASAAELENITLRGWIGFDQAIDSFGYYVDNYEFVYGEFKTATEDGVLAAGGEFASRFEIKVPLEYLEGDDHFVGFIVKLADGTVAQLRAEITIDLPELPKDITDSFVSDVNSNEVGTNMDASDLANFFIVETPLAPLDPNAACPIVVEGENKIYHLTSISDFYADVNGRYFFKANVINSDGAGWMFARGYKVVNSDEIVEKFDPAGGFYKINNYYETDSAGAMGGAGIYARLQGGKLYLMVKYYNPETVTRVGNKLYFIEAAGSELTLADNGSKVSVLVDGVTYATIELSGSIAYGDINEVQPEGEFAEKAVITLKDGTTETIENTLIAATCQCQVGIVARAGSFKFDALAVGAYSAIEVPALEIVTPEEPEPVDPDAPVLVLTPEFINGQALSTGGMTFTQHIATSEVKTEDEITFVRLTTGGGDPYVALVNIGSMLELPPYMAISYRTNSALDAHVFIGSGAGWNGNGDVTSVAWNQDQQWNHTVLDLNNAGLTSIQNGLINYCRFDFFTDKGAEGDYMDVEYVAFFNSAEAAQKYYNDLHGIVEAPKMPAEFSLSLDQVNLGKTLYFSGAMSGYYFAASENPADAVKVYSEAVEGGYRMYFMDGETKTYLDIVYRDKNKANVVLTTDPVGVYVWNAEANTWTVTIPEAEATFYLGTYNSYNTISASSVYYITGDNAANVGVSQFLAQWADVPPPHEHSYDEGVVTDPTCTENGYTTYTCACGHSYTDNVVEATGHNFVDGSCGICGEKDPDYVDPDAPATNGVDFSTFEPDDGTAKGTSYTDRTNPDGWTATGSRIEVSDSDCGGILNGAPVIVLNGKTSAIGTLTSPILAGGIQSLSFNLGYFWSETSNISLTLTITGEDGTVITETVLVESPSADTAYTYSYTLETPITGSFGITIENNALTGQDKNKDRVGIWNFTWVSAPASEEPDEPTANEIQVTTTDTYSWVDVVEFTASVSGTYTFYLPAGLGAFDVDDCDAWPPVGGPYVDYYSNEEGASFSIDLAEGEITRFYVGALTKADWVITWTVEEKEIGGGDEPGTDDPEIPVEPADDISGTYSTGGDDTLVIDMAAGTLVYTFAGRGGAQNVVEYGISIADGVVTLSNANGPITGPMAVYMGVLELDENGKPSKFYYNGYTYDVTAAGAVDPEPEQPEVGDLVLVVGNNNITITDEIIAEGGIVYQLVVTEEGTYTVKGDFFVQFQDAMGMTYGNGSYLTAGTYDVRLGTMLISAAGNYNAEVEFTAPEGGDVVEPEPDPEPSGNPVIESLPFSYEVPAEGGLDMNGVYYDFTATEEITLVISHPAGTYVSPTATNDWTSDENDNYILVVNAGETITLNFWAMDTIYEGTFTVTAKAPVHEHSYESVVTAPTCTEGGYTTYSCACGDTYTGDATDALGHDIVVDAAVEATCTATGLTAGEHCARCDYKVEQTVVDALGHNFAQNNCKNCGMAFPKYKDWDADKQIVTHQSFDELYYSAARTGIFPPGQAAGWNKIVNYTADMATLNYWGWIGAKGDIGQFGYQIDTNAAIFDAGFAVTADANVVAAAKNTGADNASRMLIPINLGGLSAGAHTVNVLYKNADGEIVALCVFSVLVPDANGNVPSTNPTAIYTADDLAAVPVMNATATKVDNYVRFENTAAQKDKNNPAIELTAAGDGFSDVIVIKYKTNCANYGSNYWGMLNLNGVGDFIGNRVNSDNWFVYNMNDEWTILVLDMRKNKATNNAMPNNDITDGANINTITYTFFDYDGNGGKKVASAEHIDIEYIAFFETKADAYAYIS